MGFGRLNVWVHDVKDPCRISDQTWRIQVTDCRNRIVRWCNQRYAGIPARCGHTEIRLPPGCYIVWGALNIAIKPPFLFANYITHFAFVEVRCDEKACVHLYAPSYKKCWRAFVLANQLIVKQGGFEEQRELVAQLEEVGNRLADAAERATGDNAFAKALDELAEVIETEPEETKDQG